MFSWLTGKKKQQPKPVEQDDIDQSELEKRGIDPTQNIKQEAQDQALTDFNNQYVGYLTLSKEQIMSLVAQYKPFDNAGEDIRDELGHSKGGRICPDKAVVSQLRCVSQQVIKQIGRKILSGDMSLTKISFPIQAMIPKSSLESSVHGTCVFPIFLNKACQTKDPLQRMKLIMTATLSSFFWTNTFLKPLNPILGETFNASYPDGTEIYCQQTSHHPPVCYFLVIGPEKSYQYYGYYLYDAKAGLNSLTIYNQGKRCIVFRDGHSISYDFPNEIYSGTLMGTLKQESVGKMTFTDNDFGNVGQVIMGKVKKRPSDYFTGTISNEGKVISNIQGTYLGYMDIDNQRYWDSRMITPIKIKVQPSPLQSDHTRRKDLITLKSGDVQKAQLDKEQLQQIQRTDAKLRKEYEAQISPKQK